MKEFPILSKIHLESFDVCTLKTVLHLCKNSRSPQIVVSLEASLSIIEEIQNQFKEAVEVKTEAPDDDINENTYVAQLPKQPPPKKQKRHPMADEVKRFLRDLEHLIALASVLRKEVVDPLCFLFSFLVQLYYIYVYLSYEPCGPTKDYQIKSLGY